MDQMNKIMQQNQQMMENIARLNQNMAQGNQMMTQTDQAARSKLSRRSSRGWKREPSPFNDLNTAIGNRIVSECGAVYNPECSNRVYAVSLISPFVLTCCSTSFFIRTYRN